jgi:hypothetical protein
MIRLTALALLLAAGLAAGPAGAQSDAAADAKPKLINTGYWNVTFHYLGLINQTERWCIRPKDIEKFMGGPCNHIYHCSYPYHSLGDGKLAFKGEIAGKDELYHCQGGGVYTATTLHMGVTCNGHWHIVPVPSASASTDATFIGDTCPPDAKHFK